MYDQLLRKYPNRSVSLGELRGGTVVRTCLQYVFGMLSFVSQFLQQLINVLLSKTLITSLV